MAMRYADIALQHDEIFDRAGFILSTEKFLEFAREVSTKLKELQKVRGLLDWLLTPYPNSSYWTIPRKTLTTGGGLAGRSLIL